MTRRQDHRLWSLLGLRRSGCRHSCWWARLSNRRRLSGRRIGLHDHRLGLDLRHWRWCFAPRHRLRNRLRWRWWCTPHFFRDHAGHDHTLLGTGHSHQRRLMGPCPPDKPCMHKQHTRYNARFAQIRLKLAWRTLICFRELAHNCKPESRKTCRLAPQALEPMSPVPPANAACTHHIHRTGIQPGATSPKAC